jgi:hypothetical protein
LSNLNRLLKEQAAQALSVGVLLLDRVVLTAVLYRTWDRATFERWSALLAVAGLLGLFELGFNLYVNNRLTIEMERGNHAMAARIYASTNFLLVLSAIAGLVCLGLLYFFDEIPVDGLAGELSPGLVLAMLALGTALRTSACGAYALYRANRQYSRLVLILSLGEFLRIVLTAGVVLLGGQLAAAGFATLIAVVGFQYGYILLDTGRRFAPHRFAVSVPTNKELREAAAISSGYFAHNVPPVLLINVPVIVLAYLEAAPGAVSIFVLLRTMTGMPRAILQTLGIVAGQECGRRLAVGDGYGALATIEHGSRAFASISGLTAGFLLAAGAVIGILWTGSSDIVRFDLMLAGLAPMLLAPVSPLAQTTLASTNTPAFPALGRWYQLLITALAAVLLPIENLALRMLVALSLGEIFGFAILAYVGMSRLVPAARWAFHAKALATCLASAVFGFTTTYGLLLVAGSHGRAATIAALGLALLLCSLSLIWFGLEPGARSALTSRALPIRRMAPVPSLRIKGPPL